MSIVVEIPQSNNLSPLELILACNDTFAYLIRDESMQFCRVYI